MEGIKIASRDGVYGISYRFGIMKKHGEDVFPMFLKLSPVLLTHGIIDFPVVTTLRTTCWHLLRGLRGRNTIPAAGPIRCLPVHVARRVVAADHERAPAAALHGCAPDALRPRPDHLGVVGAAAPARAAVPLAVVALPLLHPHRHRVSHGLLPR
jgi:hypothetical protein